MRTPTFRSRAANRVNHGEKKTLKTKNKKPMDNHVTIDIPQTTDRQNYNAPTCVFYKAPNLGVHGFGQQQ